MRREKEHLFVLFRGCEVYSTNNEIQEVHFHSGGAAFLTLHQL